MWRQARGRPGAVTPMEEAGPAWLLLLLPSGRARSSLPGQHGNWGHYANPAETDASINYVPAAQLPPGQAGHRLLPLLAHERWVCAASVSPIPVPSLIPLLRALCHAVPGQPCSPSPVALPGPGAEAVTKQRGEQFEAGAA